MSKNMSVGSSIVSGDWRMTIDSKLRHLLGVRPGTVAVQHVVDGHLEIDFVLPKDAGADGISIPEKPSTKRK